MNSQRVRCAIYTRKSSEEGLEQSFNSLEAQREACRSFILSQKHEGWVALSISYDDGGFSGGTMERPALKQLLKDIEAGKIDALVVYKVDRLTRSLGDFSKIIEVLDARKVSFVSVTQQFNTTTSMGRLTLNVLLSFAQFEREVTGERIRDKIAASKKKGMWMGGIVPLGYDCVDRQLVVNGVEADTVREIFRRYVQLGCVKKLKLFLDKKQISSKARTKNEKIRPGRPFSRGALYHVLKNPIYIGHIRHRNELYKGQHHPIVPAELWEKVERRLRANNEGRRKRTSHPSPSLLGGNLFDEQGVRLTPTHCVKNSKRYRYYTSQAVIANVRNTHGLTRLPAHELERLVRRLVFDFLKEPHACATSIRNEGVRERFIATCRQLGDTGIKLDISKQDNLIRNVLHRVIVRRSAVVVEIDKAKLAATIGDHGPTTSPLLFAKSTKIWALTAPFQTLHRGNEVRIAAPSNGTIFCDSPINSLVKLVSRAHDWYERIISGEIGTVKQISGDSHLTCRSVRQILSCAVLSPEVTEAILTGQHRPTLIRNDFGRISLRWSEQKSILGAATVCDTSGAIEAPRAIEFQHTHDPIR